MAKRYAVLYGQTGVKDFRLLKNAKKFAKVKATKLGKRVEIDKIMTNPRARQGEIDFSQSHYRFVNPRKRRR